ncbi:apolipoprotein N-acyltransferase [Curvibacter sp. APW13]|uniref:apolipoprotein N-acyltransferase n=1 Tax=Curvibacter sp. APW13 TaxID=3077236 RepID=UPI0028E02220|nr:apolipoprotein N-acyltransferase [Curvibacter sp. APW13]MDT8989625.1 apolipoprotein N-acyltransferase [Curvibacter sp. APW13]
MDRLRRYAGLHLVGGPILSAVLCGLCALGGGGWMLSFVMLVPWLRSLDRLATVRATLLSAWLMSIAFTAAAFWWFGMAIGDYTGVGASTGIVVLLVAAPLFQPQILLFALVQRLALARWGSRVAALAAVAAWVGTEWLWPKMLGDTLGHGLYPSVVQRQFADLGGSAALTVCLLLSNMALAAAWARRHTPHRAWLRPLLAALGVPVLLGSYGGFTLLMHPLPASESLRVGLVQANIVDYEQQRQRLGAEQVVRDVLDTHFAMSYDAVERQGADVVLWSETVYPTTFGNPKSEAGAEFDAAIRSIVDAANVPFVIGTYDRDTHGEYNAAAFVQPGSGLLGFYRKTRLFPLTEYVPAWLDSAWLREWLPWTGNWRAGNGARVFPLRLRDGREVPVMTAICLDDVDTQLALDGAQLGARALLILSNDSWFTRYPQGAALHQAVAAFRSIETRLPQYRVTTNGYSAVIDPTGTVVVASAMGAQALEVGELPLPARSGTLMTRWGDWVGPAASVFLAWLSLLTAAGWWRTLRGSTAALDVTIRPLPSHVFVLSAPARAVAAGLRAIARLSLLGLGAAMLLDDNLRGNTLAQMRLFALWFVLPELLCWAVLWSYRARLHLTGEGLVLERGPQRMELPLRTVSRQQLWDLPLPTGGLTLLRDTAGSSALHLATRQPLALAHALALRGVAPVAPEPAARTLHHYALTLYSAARGRLDSPVVKYLLYPLLLAIPAFHLHQNIAYGGGLGELYTFGARAYLVTLGLWWGAWAMGVFLTAAALRAAIEVGSLLSVAIRPEAAPGARLHLERVGRALLYLALPGWLALHASF